MVIGNGIEVISEENDDTNFENIRPVKMKKFGLKLVKNDDV